MFSIESFCLTVPKVSVGESFTVALISGSENFYGQQGGGEYQDFLSKIFCLTVPKVFVEEFFTVAVISGTGNVGIRGGSIKIFRRNLLSHSAEKYRRGFLYCCINFGYRKCLDNKGGVSRLSVENFCLTVPKIFVEEFFTVAVISGTGIVGIRRGGGVSRFSVEIFCLTVPKIFVGNFFTVALFSGIEKVWIIRGGIKTFCRKFLSHSAENFRRTILYCCISFR